MQCPVQERQVCLLAALVLIALEGAGGQIELAQHVTEASGNPLLALELAPQGAHRHVRQERQIGGEAGKLLVVALGLILVRRGGEAGAGEAQPEAAHQVADGKAHVAEHRLVEVLESLLLVRVAGGQHLGQHVGVAADGPLTVDDHAAGQDVGSLDGDRDGGALIAAGQVVVRTHADGLAAVDVHGVDDALLGTVGEVVLDDGGDDRGFLAEIDAGHRQLGGGAHDVGVAAQTGQRLFNPFHLADGQLELATDAAVGAGGQGQHLDAAGAVGGQGDAATDGETLHQHAPALAGHGRAADDEVERHEHLVATGRTVLERHVEGEVTTTDLDPVDVGGDEGAGDAEILFVTQQVIRVAQLEGQPQDGGDGGKRDIALVPGEAHAEHLFPFPLPFANDAEVGDGARIRSRFRAGQGETGDLLADGQAGQIVVFLLLGAVVLQQLTRAEGVGHADGGGEHGAGATQLLQHAGLGVGGELQAAVLLLDDHGEELVVLQVLPHLGGEIGALVGHFPVVDHAAHLFYRPVHEGLLLGAEGADRNGVQLLPVRVAGKEVGLPPGGARFDGFLLGAGHLRHDGLVDLEQRPGQLVAAKLHQVEGDGEHREQYPHQQGHVAIEGAGDQGGGRGKRGGEQGRPAVCHGADHQDHPEQSEGRRHFSLLA